MALEPTPDYLRVAPWDSIQHSSWSACLSFVVRHHRAMKFIPHFLWLAGVAVLLVALARGSGASLPYQDPTPELLEVQRGQLHTAKLIASAGGLLFASGIIWITCRKVFRPRSSSSSLTT